MTGAGGGSSRSGRKRRLGKGGGEGESKVKRVRCEASGLLPVLHRACACKGMQHKPPRKGVPPLPKGVPAAQPTCPLPSLPLLPSIPSSALPFFSSFLTFPAHPSLRPHLSCFRHTASCTFRGSAE